MTKEKTRKINVAMECYIRKNGEYLMLKRSEHKKIMPGVMMAPGGHVDYGEGIYEATRREIGEETGLLIKNLEIRAVGAALLKDIDTELFFYLMTADYDGGKLNTSQTDGEFMWLTKEEILNQNCLLAELNYVLPHVLGNDSKVISYKVVYKQGNELESIVVEKD